MIILPQLFLYLHGSAKHCNNDEIFYIYAPNTTHIYTHTNL